MNRDLQLEICSWIQVISQSVSRSVLWVAVSPGLVAMRTPPPLPASVCLSLRVTVMLYGGGNMSCELMSGVSHVSVPMMMSGSYFCIVWCSSARLGWMLLKFMLRALSVVLLGLLSGGLVVCDVFVEELVGVGFREEVVGVVEWGGDGVGRVMGAGKVGGGEGAVVFMVEVVKDKGGAVGCDGGGGM